MKQKAAILLAFVLAAGLAACGNAAGPGRTEPVPVQTENSRTEEKAVQETVGNAGSSEGNGAGNILIVYFAVAENSEVDAVSSASVMVQDGEAKRSGKDCG